MCSPTPSWGRVFLDPLMSFGAQWEKGFRYWTDPYARREEAHQVSR